MDNNESVPKKKFYKRWWFWVLAVIALFIIIGAMGNDDAAKDQTAGQSEQTSQSESTPTSTPAVKVTAETLMRDYQANEVAADAKYKNQTLEVSGLVDTIGKDILDTPYVSFKTNEVIFTVQCMFDKSQADQLAPLAKGQSLIVRGKVSGKLGNILLNECQIVK